MKALNILIILLTLNSAFQNIAERYKTKDFDVAIFPGSYESLIGSDKKFTPSKNEVLKAEKALSANLKALNKDLVNQYETPVIHKKLKRYKRQYFGYIDDAGNRIIYINCLHEKSSAVERWLVDIIQVSDGGSYYWNIKYNISTGELFDLSINGYA